MNKNRKSINLDVELWTQKDTKQRASFCLISERIDGSNYGSVSIGGNRELIIESIVQVMVQSPEVTQMLGEAILAYNEYVTKNSISIN